MTTRILVVDDEKNILALFRKMLSVEAFRSMDNPYDAVDIVTTFSGEEAWSLIQKESFDLIISDLAMEGMSGIELLERVKSFQPDIPFMILTGVGTIEDAVRSMKLGAYDYLTKPFQHDELLLSICKALDYGRLHLELKTLRQKLNYSVPPEECSMVGRSKAFMKMMEMVHAVASNEASVLIEGESGTGKELVARAIHAEGARKNRPFIAIHCSAITESLLESELFGHVKGAFSGASSNKKGLFLEADSGTLFLDEIADVSLAVQAKLLRAIQEKEVKPVGSNQSIPFDARIIAATNKPIRQLIEKKLFRDDLYYRMAVVTITVPALRDRKDDIPLLAHHFFKKYAGKNGDVTKSLSEDYVNDLTGREWPGNVRELESMIERYITMSFFNKSNGDNTVQLFSGSRNEAGGNGMPYSRPFEFSDDQRIWIDSFIQKNASLKTISDMVAGEAERIMILQVLGEVGDNKAEAARRLGISRPALYKKIKDHNIE
ncbi:sigma-54-dependent Fis family transcriptional regulator [bacterium]|nr:sigma-54-dependent Fis family transcriptional regulator [bacterium]